MEKEAKATYRIFGRVIDRKTRHMVAGLLVEAWDKDMICNDLVGSTKTDDHGAFRIEFDESYFQELFLDRRPDLFFKIYRENKLIKSTDDSVLWNVEAGETEITVEVNDPAAEELVPWLKINSLVELIQHEREIIDRIAHTYNGGNLFMAHPFMLLADVRVELSEQAKQEITHCEPHLLGLSPAPYNTIKASKERSTLRFHVHGLFRRESK